jgi:hypothetical protein
VPHLQNLGLLQDQLRAELAPLKEQRKSIKRHITFEELPESARFERLCVSSKHLIDTVKMVAYRAETAMAHTLGEKMARTDDALRCYAPFTPPRLI